MCGIVGYVGYREAQPVLISSLKRLEYRGYDSCGLALLSQSLQVFKDDGRIGKLETKLPRSKGRMGVGHTRWATHGKPSLINAHPHLDCTGRIAVVHNGVIENFEALRERLIAEGHHFHSETDTEVIPHLVEKYYQEDLLEAVERAMKEVRGSYAIIVLCSQGGQMVAARQDSPLIIGVGDKENFVASDVPALLDYTDRVVYLEDGDIARITSNGLKVINKGKPAQREVCRVSWSLEEAEKGGYEHFMLKEIHEQPKAIQNSFKGYLSAVEPVVDLGLPKDADIASLLLLACGTSYHAALVGKYLLEKLVQISVKVEIASEFNYMDSVVDKTLAIGITQSGETADTLKALKKAKSLGCRTLAVTNVVGSSATRIADKVFYIRAGPEISVAATKSFVTQLVALYLLALSWSPLEVKVKDSLISELRLLPSKVQQLLEAEEEIAQCGSYLSKYDNVLYVARGINYPIALEGALKLKEISYIHAEGYAAGELKHGPFALLTPTTPVVAIAAHDNTYDTLLSNIKEIKAREAPVLAVAGEDDQEIARYVDFLIRVPETSPLFSPVLNGVALQLLAYYAARERGLPIDMPRNLAKSVTVE